MFFNGILEINFNFESTMCVKTIPHIKAFFALSFLSYPAFLHCNNLSSFRAERYLLHLLKRIAIGVLEYSGGFLKINEKWRVRQTTGGHLIEFHLIESVDRKFLII
jgi:hypothetical protein